MGVCWGTVCAVEKDRREQNEWFLGRVGLPFFSFLEIGHVVRCPKVEYIKG